MDTRLHTTQKNIKMSHDSQNPINSNKTAGEFYRGRHGNEGITPHCVKWVASDRHSNRLIDKRNIFKVILRSARLVFPAASVRNYRDKKVV